MYDSTLHRQRSAFSSDDLATASPRRIIVKCFDRLVVDIDQTFAAIESDDPETANRLLGHAQDLLGEVAGMLDTSAWEHAGGLLAIYDYVLRLLAVANIQKAVAPLAEARRLLVELGDGFRQAADGLDRGAASAAPASAFGAAAAPSSEPHLVLTRRPARSTQGFSAIA